MPTVQLTDARFATAVATAREMGMPAFTQAELQSWMQGRADRIASHGSFNVVVAGTDGCARHILEAVMPGIRAIAPSIQFVEKPMGAAAFQNTAIAQTPEYWKSHSKDEIWQASFPVDTWEAMYRADAILFGAVGDPRFDHDGIPGPLRPQYSLLRMRKGFDLFANFRPGFVFPALRHLSPLKPELLEGVDEIMVIRELTSGIYYGEPRGYIRSRSRSGDTWQIEVTREQTQEAIETEYYSEAEAERTLRVAFEYARAKRKKLTLFHKANALPYVGEIWLRPFNRLKQEFSDVQADDLYADIGIAKMVSNPSSFGVIVSSNLFGDVAGDVLGSVVGRSVGLIPSAGIGDGVWPAYFEPVHGSATKRFPASGKLEDSIVDPTATWLSAAMMVEHLGLTREGAAMRKAVELALASGLRNYQLFRGLAGERKVRTKELADAFAENATRILAQREG